MFNTVIIWLTDNLATVTLALAVALTIVLLLLIAVLFRLRKLAAEQKPRLQETSGTSLEELLQSYLAKAQSAENKVNELNLRSQQIEGYVQKSLQNVSVLRFNAFENMGGDLSFAAAFLDLNGDGLVISSINSREESRVYAKPVTNGRSGYTLSKEEIAAIKQAVAQTKATK